MTETFFGEFDLASLSIWLFWIFFALLIYYLQSENMREGYPLEDEAGDEASNLGLVGMPMNPKTFVLPHDRGEVTVPSAENEDLHRRTDLALAQGGPGAGFPFDPTGDPMRDGVGPASWTPRRDAPELDGHGHPKIVPMGQTEDFRVTAGRDPRGLPVQAGDGVVVGGISDMWIDQPEQLVRFLEIALAEEFGGGTRLVPIQMAKIKRDRVKINSIYGHHFADVPTSASPRQVTMLEEEKIMAYYAGGVLYASTDRQEPAL